MMMKKGIATVLVLILLITMNVEVSFAETRFSDTKGHWSEKIVQEAADLGIVSGYVDGTFKPDNLMKREEFFKLVSNVLTTVPDTTKTTLNFTDIDPIEWYVPTMKIAVAAGITNGYGDGKAGIGLMISRQEVAKIVASIIPDTTSGSAEGIASMKDASEIADWAYPYVDKMFRKGYMQGDGDYFKPTMALTRAEAATILLNVKKNEPVIAGGKGNPSSSQNPTSGAIVTKSGLSGSGSKGDPFVVTTAAELNKVREYTTAGAFFVLKNDISITADLATGAAFDEKSKSNWSDGNFTPIGSKAEPFQGYFDGKGHTITGLEIQGLVKNSGETGMANYAGLFGYLGDKSVIENITIEDSKITGRSNTGAIAGYSAGTIENCVVEKGTEVNGDNQTGGIAGSSDGILKYNVNKGSIIGNGVYAGGIVGWINGSGTVISDCTNKGSVTGSDNIGGIAGIINTAGSLTVKTCVNSGKIKTEGSNAGGITGTANAKGVTIESCSNSGEISSKTAGGIAGVNSGQIMGCSNTGTIKGFNCAGGITATQSEKSGKIFKCYNAGDVTSVNNAGGIVGSNDARVSYSYNTGDISGSTATGGIAGQNTYQVWNVYNTGEISGSVGAGALIGYNSGELENSFWLQGSFKTETGLNDSSSKLSAVKQITSEELSGKTIVKVANEEDSIVNLLNKGIDTLVWRIVQGDPYSYPQLIM